MVTSPDVTLNDFMIILHSDELTKDYTIGQIAEFDTKAAILKSFDIIHVGIAKSHTKHVLATAMEHVFNDNPALFLNALPEEEQRLITKLVVLPQDKYVEHPYNKSHHLLMQKLHLVLSYHIDDMWHIYMSNSIRHRIDKMAQDDLKYYPELAEFNKLLEEITYNRNKLFDLMDKNASDSLKESNLKQFSDEINAIDQFYTDAKKRLKKLEPYLKKNTKTNLKVIHDDIENTEFMLGLAKASLSFKQSLAQSPSSPKPSVSSNRSSQKHFTILDIRKAHPRGLCCDSDKEYADFANRLMDKMRYNSESAGWSIDYRRKVALKATLYFEDLVSEVGLWKTFVNQHQKLYGKPLPFYDVESDYNADYPCVQDVQYLIWDCLIELQEDTIPNPENAGLLSIAKDITSLMEKEFEDIAINDDLVSSLQDASYCQNFYELRQVLKWFYFDCYLTSGRFTDYYYNEDKKFFVDTMGADPFNALYGAECLSAFNQKIGPLAYEPKEWLALFLDQLGKRKEAADVRQIYCSDVEPFQLISYDKKSVRFRNWKNEEFSVRRTEMFKFPDRQLRDPKVNGSIGTFACYRGEWFLSGLNSWGDISKPWDGYCADKRNKEQATVSNYQHLMQLSGGSSLFYFANLEELRKFQIEEMGIPEDQYQTPPVKSKIKNIVLFVPEEHGVLGFMFNNVESICDPRNPFYNKTIARKEALNLITDVDGVAGEFVRYAVSHSLLPDAAMKSMASEERGLKLTQQNLDFLARTLRRQEY